MASTRLVNDFSWSFSRQNTFKECKKRYWYIYYGSWEGWPKTAWDKRPSVDPLAAYLYQLKNMQRLSPYLGSTVHETIEKHLKSGMTTKQLPPLADLISEALEAFDTGIEESRLERWRENPKKYGHLFEHYYHEPLTDAQLDDARVKIRQCLTNWYESPIVKMVLDERATWVSVEQLASFTLAEKYKIIVVIDFAVRWRSNGSDDVYILFDWKTGAKTEKTDEQLLSYALFATKVYNARFDRIILTPYYLFSNEYSKIGFQQKEPISEEKLHEVEEKIIASCDAMAKPIQGLKVFPGSPPPDPTLFPYTEERSQCAGCPFRELCQKVDYREVPTEELRAAVKELS